ncbi:MAG: tRNA pseudouridine(38-40) synthase TruA [Candidatus Krumholzibacteriia bacterium]|nr:tRNA pseudouridine(38-40) synthase TruA [bacterium]MCB9514666.1 tRNA pseudouridine(38-40) synthase TruA [Candidatus Latescibacterota bacterium]
MPTYRLVLAYDGADFHGWQRQPGRRTVQGELERALAVLAREPVAVQGAGRTDAGVHALAQCASFTVPTGVRPGQSPRRLLGSLQGLLPEDVTPLRLHEAPADFNARFSATARFYVYRLGLGHCAPLRRLRWELGWRLDVEAMEEALALLREGTDFRGFSTREGAAKGSRCALRELALDGREPEAGELRLRIGADRFLHNMVRIVVGTLVEIGRGRWRPERVAEILASGDRRLAGPTAPPQGLFLRAVEYPERFLDPAGEPGP